ncbi:MAG TPA: OsmC family protein [Gemmatimonadaceae bacterium]|nr:OsmC family protein [Gemmatimonadaceae bacterium]
MKHDRPGRAADVRADLRVGLTWVGDLRFEAGPAGHIPHLIDGDTRAAPSPPQVLLEALASCVTVDVVLILRKMQMPPAAVACDITAERAEGTPRRVVKAHLHYRIAGDGIVEERAMRAIELAVTKYCTVRDSMDPEIPVTWSLDLSASARGSRAAALEGEPL